MKLTVFISILSVALSQITTVDFIENTAQLSTLNELLNITGLKPVLNSINNTVFAPTNAAFDALGSGVLDALKQNIPQLTQILTYHVLPGAVDSPQLGPDGRQFVTVNGQNITVDTSQGLGIRDAIGALSQIISPDNAADNGFVHIINGVLTPIISAVNVTTTAPPVTSTTALTSTTSGPQTTSTTSGPPVTTSDPNLPAENAKAIEELTKRVDALEQQLKACGCGTKKPTYRPAKGKGGYGGYGGPLSRIFGRKNGGFFGRRYNGRRGFW